MDDVKFEMMVTSEARARARQIHALDVKLADEVVQLRGMIRELTRTLAAQAGRLSALESERRDP